MDIFWKIAERRISEAMERGEFENLTGAGTPLVIEEDLWVPEDLRMSYRLLKTQGYIPPELELRKEILTLNALIKTLDDDKERLKRIRELNFKVMKLGMMRKEPLSAGEFPDGTVLFGEYEGDVFRKCIHEGR